MPNLRIIACHAVEQHASSNQDMVYDWLQAIFLNLVLWSVLKRLVLVYKHISEVAFGTLYSLHGNESHLFCFSYMQSSSARRMISRHALSHDANLIMAKTSFPKRVLRALVATWITTNHRVRSLHTRTVRMTTLAMSATMLVGCYLLIDHTWMLGICALFNLVTFYWIVSVDPEKGMHSWFLYLHLIVILCNLVLFFFSFLW